MAQWPVAASCLKDALLTTWDERRNASRFGRDHHTEHAVLFAQSNEGILADVFDESLGGLGMYVDQRISLVPGQSVEVSYRGDRLEGRICHVQATLDGRLRVGIECRPVTDSSD